MRSIFVLVGGTLLISVIAVAAALLVGQFSMSGRVEALVALPTPSVNTLQLIANLENDADTEVGFVHRGGPWVAFDMAHNASWDIFLLDVSSGRIRALTNHFASDRFPVISPDGSQVAFISWRDGNSEVYLADIRSGELRNLSQHPGRDLLPVWSPDGSWLAFVSDRDNNFEIYVVDVARGLQVNLTHNPAHDTMPQWSADGSGIAFKSYHDRKEDDYYFDIGGHHRVHLEDPAASRWVHSPSDTLN